MQYKDYKPETIAQKLKDVESYEASMGVDARSKAWRKWCTNPVFRKREWQLRQATVNLYKYNNKIL